MKLPFQFDANRMLKELKLISNSFELIRNQYTGNSLTGMHLIHQNPDGSRNSKGESFVLSEELKSCPYLQEVLDTFQCDKFVFRTQNLLPGGKIGKHNDGDKGLKNGLVRLNIPVDTNEEVYTYYDGKRLPMKSGECWLPNVIKDHEMENRSNRTRWMLMIDCDLNDWWKDLLLNYDIDLRIESKYRFQSLEELENIKMCFLDMGLDLNNSLVKEVDSEILLRQSN